ncbi:MAG: DUF982 domain-containing protein [Rhizobium sp.]|nr:DUF982 domain-containing protein [Rhizobium sp.]MBW8322347.1 DUF982 domain-containing protein [Rhizobium sp.]MBW8444516.1 DUF982 domain-containing protein [Arenimonas sp.]
MTPGNSTWTDPVELKLQSGLKRTFREPYDALYFLEEEWPTRSGVAFERAKRWCRLAIETDEAVFVARKAFIAAARQAGMLADGDGTGQDSSGGQKAVA